MDNRDIDSRLDTRLLAIAERLAAVKPPFRGVHYEDGRFEWEPASEFSEFRDELIEALLGRQLLEVHKERLSDMC